ncbi:MAG: hypothetical protein IJE78_05755 [Bacteroidaceae bacterium]|nr:hypothetical protein [Bacteroidaceae bacterium]
MMNIRSAYWDEPERPIDPPDYDEPFYEDDTEGVVDFSISDVNIVVDEDGSWEFEDIQAPWADNVDTFVDTAYGFINVTDGEGIRDAVYDIIDSHEPDSIPVEPGVYKLSCDVNLVYMISNITSEQHDEDDIEYYTDDAECKLNTDASNVYHLRIVAQ